VHKYLIIVSLKNVLERQASNLKYDCVTENICIRNIIPIYVKYCKNSYSTVHILNICKL